MVVGVISAAVQGGLTGIFTRWLGEKNLIRLSFLGTGISLLLMPVSQGIMAYFSIALLSFFTALLTPVVSAAISNQELFEHGLAMRNNFV